MVASGFRSSGHLSFIHQFAKKWHRLASTASDKKDGKFQYDISWIYQINIFSKHQNKAEFKNLDDSKVLSRNFPDLRTSAASMTSTASTTSMASMTFTASFHQKHYLLWWLDHPWHQNDQYRSLFVEWIIKNPIFHWYYHYFCWRLLRPVDVTFLKTGGWNSNAHYSWSH